MTGQKSNLHRKWIRIKIQTFICIVIISIRFFFRGGNMFEKYSERLPYFKQHLQNVRNVMAQEHIDIMVVGIGSEYTYLTGEYDYECHQMMREWGDWVDCLIFSIDHDPVAIDHELDINRGVFAPEYPFEERFVLPLDDPNPINIFKKALSKFDPDGKTIAIPKLNWSENTLAIIEAFPNARVITIRDDVFDRARMVKDEYEISCMREAGRITVDVLEAVAKKIKPGMSVWDVRAELSYQMIVRKVDGTVQFGGAGCVNENSDKKDKGNPNNILLPRSTVFFDYGVNIKGYHTDFGRTLFVGEPHPDALVPYKIITGIVQDVTRHLGDGKITPAEMFHLGNDEAKRTGYYEGYGYYQWSIGHGIGTEVHEWPWLRDPHPSAYEPVRAGMIFAVEPKINKFGQFYVRCEDELLVGPETGENLTPFTYEPVIIE